MGLGNNTGKITYVNIKKGMLAIKKDNEAHLFEYIDGTLADIEIREEEYQGEKYKKLCLKINDGREDFLVQMRLDSGYGRAFCRILPNIQFDKPFKLSPTFSDKDGKQSGGMFINQNGNALKWYYTKEHMHDLPPMEEVTFKGKTAWDNTRQINFFTNLLLNEIKPKLIHSVVSGPPHEFVDNETDAANITRPVDDLPF